LVQQNLEIVCNYSSRLILFYASPNRLCLTFCSVINYNDVTCATSSHEFVKNVRFTDIWTEFF